MSDFTPFRFGARKDWETQRWHLEIAIPARKDQWDDSDDVCVRVGVYTYPTEASALSALAEGITQIVHG